MKVINTALSDSSRLLKVIYSRYSSVRSKLALLYYIWSSYIKYKGHLKQRKMKPLIAASVYPLKKGTRVSQEMNNVIYDLQGSDSVCTPHTFFFYFKKLVCTFCRNCRELKWIGDLLSTSQSEVTGWVKAQSVSIGRYINT